MRSGDLDQRINIQNYTTTRGASGEEISAWAAWTTVWAQVTTLSGTEKSYGPQLVAEATHKIKIRYLDGVVPTIRIDWQEKILDILFIDESRRRQGEMYLLCREAVKS